MDFDLSWESGFDPENAQETFESMLSETDDRLVSLMTDTANNIERDAKRRSPVETGNLRASWGSEISTGRNKIVAEIGNEARYARFIEFGTSKMDPQPMIRPAIDSEIQRLERQIQLLILKAAEDVGDG